MSRVIITASLLAAAALGLVTSGSSAQGVSGSAGPTVTIANVPLPVVGEVSVVSSGEPLPITGEVNITGASEPVPVRGSVSIIGTPTVEIWPQRIPYHFRLTSGSLTHAIPEGTMLDIRHVSCRANTAFETNAALGVVLTSGAVPDQVTLLQLRIPQIGQSKRSYGAMQTTAAYLGVVANRDFGRELTLGSFLDDSTIGFFIDCYIAGELSIL